MESLVTKLNCLRSLYEAKNNNNNKINCVLYIESQLRKSLTKSTLDYIGMSPNEYSQITKIIKKDHQESSSLNSIKKRNSGNLQTTTSEEPASFGSSIKSSDYKSIRSKSPSLTSVTTTTTTTSATSRGSPTVKKPPVVTLMASSRVKNIDEPVPLTNTNSLIDSTPDKLSENTSAQPVKRPRGSKKSNHESSSKDKMASFMSSSSKDLCEYLNSCTGDILYSQLFKDEIQRIDKMLLETSRERCSYAGKTNFL